jgi:hypothetical protein
MMSSPVKHNHPPVKGLVNDCEYCQIYGNVFSDGPFKVDETKLKPHMVCFKDIQITKEEELLETTTPLNST